MGQLNTYNPIYFNDTIIDVIASIYTKFIAVLSTFYS